MRASAEIPMNGSSSRMPHRKLFVNRLVLAPWLAVTLVCASSFAGPVIRSLSFREDFEKVDLSSWAFPFPEDWAILAEGPNHFLHMKRSREPGVPRRPLQFALLKGTKVGSFEFQTRVRREGRSMIVVFNYVDTLHFYYAHLSGDRAQEQPVHNGVFIVNGEPRKRIAGLDAPPALPDGSWHHIRVSRDTPSGLIEVFVDRQETPLFNVDDRTFVCGWVGIGSFDETGDFDDVALRSNDAGCESAGVVRPASVKSRHIGRIELE